MDCLNGSTIFPEIISLFTGKRYCILFQFLFVKSQLCLAMKYIQLAWDEYKYLDNQ